MQTITRTPVPGSTMQSVLEGLMAEAIKTHGIGAETARDAARATRRALGSRMRSEGLGAAETSRVRAYFMAVVRSEAFKRRRNGDAAYRARIKVATLVADLRSVGTPVDRIRDEVVSFFGEGALRMLEDEAVA